METPPSIGGQVGPLHPWKVLHEAHLLAAAPWLDVYRDRVQLPDQRVIDDFYRVVMPDFAIVAALTHGREFVMVRSYKHGLGRVCLSAPAGYLEAGEAPLEGARRELLEETGYEAQRWRHLGQFLLDGNRHCGLAHLFMARDAERITAPSGGGDLEEARVELLPVIRLGQAIADGDIALLPTVSVLTLALTLDTE